MRKIALIAVAGLALVTAACELLPTLLGIMLLVLGVSPAQGFSDPSSGQYGRVTLNVTGQDDGGLPALVAADMIEVETADGKPCDVADVDEKPGHSKGSFVMLVDDSGSTELATATDCEGCPTDPSRMRVSAVQALSVQVSEVAPDWRLAIMDFGTDSPSDGFSATRIVSDYTEDHAATKASAEQLVSVAGTPLWDSTFEVLATVKADVSANFQTASDPDVGWGIVVLSDGQDTESTHTLDEVIAKAKELQIQVHCIGLGTAADKADGSNFQTAHVDMLRRLADETGGFYGSVEQPDQLPELYKNIANSLIAGYQKVDVTMPVEAEPGAPVAGRIGIKGSPLKVPFRFTAR